LLEARRPKIERLVCDKGTALVWASNLLHGGAPIVDPGSTRMSQVTHYYFEDCIYYTPVYSDTALGELALREIRDIRTGDVVPHRLNGLVLHAEDVGYKNREVSRLRRAPKDIEGESPDLLAKLEGECDVLRGHVNNLEAERARHLSDLAGFLAERAQSIAHAEDLEQQLQRIRSRPSHRVLGALKDLLLGGRGR
jgi:hypothetical protein